MPPRRQPSESAEPAEPSPPKAHRKEPPPQTGAHRRGGRHLPRCSAFSPVPSAGSVSRSQPLQGRKSVPQSQWQDRSIPSRRRAVRQTTSQPLNSAKPNPPFQVFRTDTACPTQRHPSHSIILYIVSQPKEGIKSLAKKFVFFLVFFSPRVAPFRPSAPRPDKEDPKPTVSRPKIKKRSRSRSRNAYRVLRYAL